jgi:hypothetical protein
MSTDVPLSPNCDASHFCLSMIFRVQGIVASSMIMRCGTSVACHCDVEILSVALHLLLDVNVEMILTSSCDVNDR